MDNWEDQFHERRPIAVGTDRYKVWDIEPGEISGSGQGIERGSFIELEEPINSGLFSLPGMSLETDAGGNLKAAVELWDEEEQVGESSISQLDAADTVDAMTDYELPDLSVTVPSQDATGTFYSAWAACVIPAVRFGLLMARSGDGGATFGGQPVGASTVSVSGSLTIEFGDAGGGVVGSVDVLSGSQSGGSATSAPSAATCQAFTSGAVAKVRLKMVVASSSNTWAGGACAARVRRMA